MSAFAIQIMPVTVFPHPNAESLEILQVGPDPHVGFQCIHTKGKCQTGDLVAYIPEGSLLPPSLLEEMGLVGRLAGPDKNRVKAVRLRGEPSIGLVWYPEEGWDAWFSKHRPNVPASSYEGTDISGELGITKYIPPIPVGMAGKMVGDAPCFATPVDFNSILTQSDMFQPGEPVYVTAKIHGTQINILFDGQEVKISSKGVLGRNRATLEEESGNLYWRVFRQSTMESKLEELYSILGAPFQLSGELYGHGVQDHNYGCQVNERYLAFFDLRVEEKNYAGRYIDTEEFFTLMDRVGLPTVPLLFVGPYNFDTIRTLTSGPCIPGNGAHEREGVVIKSAHEGNHRKYGRKVAKSISPEYMFRKGMTSEYE